MQRAVRRSTVIQCVLPAAGVLARLRLAILDVLAEVNCLFGRDIETDGLSQVQEGELTILVFVKPIKQVTDFILGCFETPVMHELHEPVKFDAILRWHTPLVKDALK